jgi:hypothetical protein
VRFPGSIRITKTIALINIYRIFRRLFNDIQHLYIGQEFIGKLFLKYNKGTIKFPPE